MTSRHPPPFFSKNKFLFQCWPSLLVKCLMKALSESRLKWTEDACTWSYVFEASCQQALSIFTVFSLKSYFGKKNWNVNHYQYSEKYQIYIINRTLFLKIHDHKQYLHVKCVCYCWIPINILGLIKGKTTRFSFKKISMIFFSLRKQTPKLKFGTFRIKMNKSLIKR